MQTSRVHHLEAHPRARHGPAARTQAAYSSVGSGMALAIPPIIADHRDSLLTILATLTCLRVSEVAELTVCDLWLDYLTGMGVPSFEGTYALFVRMRKKDGIRKGHFPALGRSRDPGLDVLVVLQLTGLAALDWLVRSARMPEATATPSEMSRLPASIPQDVQDSGRAHRPDVGHISTPEGQRGYQADGRHRRL